MRNPADVIGIVVILFIVGVVGFFLFPGLHTEIKAVDTTGWNVLAAGVVALLPYAFLGGMAVGALWLWHRR